MKKRYIIILIICIVLVLGLAVVADRKPQGQGEDGTGWFVRIQEIFRSKEPKNEGASNGVATGAALEGDPSGEAQNGNGQGALDPALLASYVCPIDFEALQKQNKDIYAWLEIPGTDISYPVLQHSKDDSYYLNHGESGKYDERGALFTEKTYNGTDFEDPVTAIYGHRIKSGKFFGKLQQLYTDDFEKYRELVIYTPEQEIHYQVFAAVAFSNRHILYYYDRFQDSRMMADFVKDLNAVRSIGSYVDKSVEIENTDQLLVLSTCLQGDRTCRFLVVGKKID